VACLEGTAPQDDAELAAKLFEEPPRPVASTTWRGTGSSARLLRWAGLPWKRSKAASLKGDVAARAAHAAARDGEGIEGDGELAAIEPRSREAVDIPTVTGTKW